MTTIELAPINTDDVADAPVELPEQVRRRTSSFRPEDAYAIVGALAAALDVLASVDLRDQVGAIDLPVRLIAGDRDMLTPLAAAKWLAQALPRGSLRIIRGAAHAPFLSHPDAFVAAMLEAEDHGER